MENNLKPENNTLIKLVPRPTGTVPKKYKHLGISRVLYLGIRFTASFWEFRNKNGDLNAKVIL